MRLITQTKVIHLNMFLRVVKKILKMILKPLMKITLMEVIKAIKRPQDVIVKTM